MTPSITMTMTNKTWQTQDANSYLTERYCRGPRGVT
jgi:hypothetical protein